MHCSSFELESGEKDGEVLVAIATMVTEGRIPGKLNPKSKGFYEGPHCPTSKTVQEHQCNSNDYLCKRYNGYKSEILSLWQKGIPLCIEVLLIATCSCEDKNEDLNSVPDPKNCLLLEQWCLNINFRRPKDVTTFNFFQLVNAIRSQLHFSQISAWLSTEDKIETKLEAKNLHYRITLPGETYEATKFSKSAIKHQFPLTDIGNGYTIVVTFLSLPRTSTVPIVPCTNCSLMPESSEVFDDCLHNMCTIKGKHCCEDIDESYTIKKNSGNSCQIKKNITFGPSTSYPKPKLNLVNAKIKNSAGSSLKKDKDKRFFPPIKSNAEEMQQNIINVSYSRNDLNKQMDKGQILLDAIIRSGQKNGSASSRMQFESEKSESDSKDSTCDNSCESDIFSIRDKTKYRIYIDDNCDNYSVPKYKKLRDVSNLNIARSPARQKLTFEDHPCKPDEKDPQNNGIPSAIEQAKFRKNLDSAASMVFHSRTGLPLTSSPAPARRGKSCFDFDSSINSVSAIKSALFASSFSTDDDSESDGSLVSPCSPEAYCPPAQEQLPVKCQRRGHGNSLLGL